MSLTSRAEYMDARTPEDRVRFVDFLRALSICMVVLGHWLVVAIFVENGRLQGANVLGILDWTHPLTWLFQVMPLFFLVGGVANAMSWDSERRKRSGQWVPWVVRRTERLLRPTTLFLALGVAAVMIARAAGADPRTVAETGWLVTIALWFLATYVGIAAAAPLMFAVHERWGLRAMAVLVAGVVVVDVAHVGFGVPFVGTVNYALGWLALHQLGFFLRDGSLTRSRLTPPAMAVIGLALVVGLTVFGPYPVSMVNVPGDVLHNTAPPTVALLALGFAQAGLALTVRPGLDRWLERPRVWLVVVSVNAVILTIYLWHMVPIVVVALLQLATGLLPQPDIDTGAWLALRLPWVAILVLILAPIVAVAGRFERAGGRLEPPEDARYRVASMVMAAAGVLLASGGLVLFTLGGLHGDGPLGLPVPALALYVPALVLLRLAPVIRSEHAGAR